MTSKGYQKLSIQEGEEAKDELQQQKGRASNKKSNDKSTDQKKFSRRYYILFGLFMILMFGVGVTVGIVLRQKTGKKIEKPSWSKSKNMSTNDKSVDIQFFGRIQL